MIDKQRIKALEEKVAGLERELSDERTRVRRLLGDPPPKYDTWRPPPLVSPDKYWYDTTAGDPDPDEYRTVSITNPEGGRLHLINMRRSEKQPGVTIADIADD